MRGPAEEQMDAGSEKSFAFHVSFIPRASLRDFSQREILMLESSEEMISLSLRSPNSSVRRYHP